MPKTESPKLSLNQVCRATYQFGTALLETFVIFTRNFRFYETMRNYFLTTDEQRGGGGETIVTDDNRSEQRNAGVKIGLKEAA